MVPGYKKKSKYTYFCVPEKYGGVSNKKLPTWTEMAQRDLSEGQQMETRKEEPMGRYWSTR